MDVILEASFLNGLLAAIYGLAAVGFFRLIYHLRQTNPMQYQLALSKKSWLLGILYAIMATTVTVSYQNLTNDNSAYILWLRLCLISSISIVVWRWSCLVKDIRKITHVSTDP